MDVKEKFRQKFETYRKIMDEEGEQKAWDTLFEGYPERQKQNMGQFIDNDTLANGFTKAIPFYKQIGMDMAVVDISNNGMDAVVEVQRVCPVMDLAKEYGFDKPCKVICEMDVEATKKGFGNMSGGIIASIADGDCVCLFKYEREKK
jgi:predicted ArsR family transcriptional regulator